MMGIRSDFLYQSLTLMVVEKDASVLRKVEPQQLIPELLVHMTDTIPHEIFQTGSDTESLVARLKFMGEHLTSQFANNHVYPFTMHRICEVCFHPLKYFKTHELGKFVNALEKCCLVSSPLEEESETACEDVSDAGNVSLSKIPWVTQVDEKDLASFLREIEATVSANFGYEQDDDEGEEGDGLDISRNSDVQHNLLDDDDDDDDEDDEDYSDDLNDEEDAGSGGGEDEEIIVEEQIEEDESYSDDETSNGSNEHRGEIEGAGAIDEGETTSEDEDTETSDALRKRKTTELDDFGERDSEVFPVNTTPKKKKHGLAGDASLAESPLFAQGTAVQSKSVEHQVSVLISPSTAIPPQPDKVAAVTDDGNETSPLSYKSSRR
ncbi:Psy4p [Lachancea thermotolerans CBS 6340]|uniref:KLTH0E01738p n=1 Tax=Lachancea thermotolerans (strain ATCC 56472 / CBS 6340 / NRRL Y-8284) TaxID=559295 RepID=C5DH66_LACTC|nr:KLTH0E01738p [Lachancea thermotolerans CBS 6340]CAR23127.1 KLTH0E01738p [Lachancea thermotolerans CBS 6340]